MTWSILYQLVTGKLIPAKYEFIPAAIEAMPVPPSRVAGAKVALRLLVQSGDVSQHAIDFHIGTGDRLAAWIAKKEK